MKKRKMLAMSFIAALLSAPTYQAQASELTVNFWNKDVGPVEGGRFLEDQKYVAEGHVLGKQPGSGLFMIPIKDRKITEDDNWGLFDLKPVATVIYKEGKVETINTGKEDTVFLGLPGEKTTFKISLSSDRYQISMISFALTGRQYSFTTSGGSVWIPPQVQSSEQAYREVSAIAALPGTKIHPYQDLNVIFSWPESLAEEEEEAEISTAVTYKSYTPTITTDNLVANWKSSICDLHVDNKVDGTGKYCCYPTRGFNRRFEGAIRDAGDLYNLGEKFAYVAGHELDANPFSK
ncbi:hypothetical protein [Candidatus Odyssella thessalonicensis]|uniref:hypothetical protein n=1 Tax=Candidatus Odyssella thessalonicensis TaxID=84647 RepID=UPI000225B730|nr:hypothetical protein [Candidatus Odyssella thessalonicensis]